jgi:hypothetical protein
VENDGTPRDPPRQKRKRVVNGDLRDFFFLQKAQAEHQARIWSRDDVEV